MLTFLIMPLLSFGLVFSKHENDSRTLTAIRATGKIETGDTAKLQMYIKNLTPKKHIAIYLDSAGGNLYEGMKLGRFFKKRHIKTVIQGYKSCLSACALAFLGGTDSKGRKWMSSTTTSFLGFHAFHYSDEKNLDTDFTQKVVSDILQYGIDIDAPMEIFVKQFSTPSSSIHLLTIPEELHLDIKVWDIANHKFLTSSTKKSANLHQNSLQFMKKYFSDILAYPKNLSWNKLSASMKKSSTFKQYSSWWNSVKNIDILRDDQLDDHTVKMLLRYKLKSGKTICTIDTFSLLRTKTSWRINGQTIQRATCK